VLQPGRREADADHLDVGDDRSRTAEDGSEAGAHGIGVEGGEAVELEIGVGVDHSPHERPLLLAVAVRADFGVDDGEGIVLDGSAGGGELFGDGVAGHGVSPGLQAGLCEQP